MISIIVSTVGFTLLAVMFAVDMFWLRRPTPPLAKVGDDVLVTTIAGRVVRVDDDWLLLRMSSDPRAPLVRVLASSVVRRWPAEKGER